MSKPWKTDLEQLLMRRQVGFLSTSGSGGPETSMAPFALFQGDILLHLSGLARHTKNLERSSIAGFMICDSERESESPLSMMRVSLQGDVLPVDDAELALAKEAYLRAVPDAGPLFDFADFKLFKLSVTAIYWVGGFGSARELSLSQWKSLNPAIRERRASHLQGFHAHIYYDAESYEQAAELCDRAGELFGVAVGHKHKQLVGPHPCWSCQLTLTPDQFGEVVPWLAMNRNGLTVFIHAETGDVMRDHTEHTMWMGKMESLNMEILKQFI